MKIYFLFLIQLFLYYSLLAQYSSIHGESLPASGTLRVFLVYAQMDCSQCPTLCHPDNSSWLPDSLPPNPESWFDTYYTGGTPQTFITKYFYEASFGNYIMLDDRSFKKPIPVT
jgi:hypothetical protein